MTVCVAAICEQGKALVLAADKMVGMGYVEGEPDITKLRKLHKDWWVMFAGDNLSPIFDIIDYAKASLRDEHKLAVDSPASLRAVMESIERAFEKKRIEDAETLYLKPTKWTMNRFNRDGHQTLPNAAQIQADIDRFYLQIQFLVAGFEQGDAFIFELDGWGVRRGIAERRDIPGFESIGSGRTVATFMLYWRKMSPNVGAREGLYYVLEAKYYGEQATGVSASTDLYIAKPGQDLIHINDEKVIEKKLIPICQTLDPGDLQKKHILILNSLPELEGFPPVKGKPKKSKNNPAAT